MYSLMAFEDTLWNKINQKFVKPAGVYDFTKESGANLPSSMILEISLSSLVWQYK